LPQEFGKTPLMVSPDCGLRYFGPLSKVDPFLLNVVKRVVHSGDVVWDIGANLGLFSFAAASCAEKEGFVLAVEPDPWLVKLIERSNRLRPEGNACVTPLAGAVCDRVGSAIFHVAQRARAASHIAGFESTQAGGTRRELTVKTFTLDSLLEQFPAPCVLKI